MIDVMTQLAAGVAVGAQYALIALGFVVIFKATGVMNLAHGGLVLFGAYIAYTASVTWQLPFYLAIVIAMIAGAAIGVLIEETVLCRMIGRPVFSIILITFGLLTVMQEVASSIWGTDELSLNAPYSANPSADVVRVDGVIIPYENIALIVIAALVLGAFFALFQFSRTGVAMRATAIDAEAALAQGISTRRVQALSWGIAGAVAAIAGVTAVDGPAPTLTPALSAIALGALPVVILGGVDSPAGAVLASAVVGVTQSLAQGWETGVIRFDWLPTYPSWLGNGFSTVLPYVVMVIILMIRPYGLLGTKTVRRA
jgi:branched-chain amino acid transport system permease protein